MVNISTMVGRRPITAAIAVSLSVTSACSETRIAHEATPPSTVHPTEPPCEVAVSDLLVPGCGAWFGASTPSSDGRYDYVRGLEEYERLVGVEPDILHFYQRGGEPFPTAEHKALAERPGRQRSILYFNWKPAPDLTWRQIAEGAADPSIDAVARALIDYPHTMFLTIQHEPENDLVNRDGSGMMPADYVAMYRHVVGRLKSLGVDNVVFVMGYMGFERWSTIVDSLYPGDDVVDWIAYDPYGFESHDQFAEMLNDPGGDGWPGFYRWATAKAPETPIMLGEWGFDLPHRPAAPDIISGGAETLRHDFPAIKAIVYWNDRTNDVDARLGQGGETADRFVEAYTELANDPYFNETPTELAP
jgi:hypothetical protein